MIRPGQSIFRKLPSRPESPEGIPSPLLPSPESLSNVQVYFCQDAEGTSRAPPQWIRSVSVNVETCFHHRFLAQPGVETSESLKRFIEGSSRGSAETRARVIASVAAVESDVHVHCRRICNPHSAAITSSILPASHANWFSWLRKTRRKTRRGVSAGWPSSPPS